MSHLKALHELGVGSLSSQMTPMELMVQTVNSCVDYSKGISKVNSAKNITNNHIYLGIMFSEQFRGMVVTPVGNLRNLNGALEAGVNEFVRLRNASAPQRNMRLVEVLQAIGWRP